MLVLLWALLACCGIIEARDVTAAAGVTTSTTTKCLTVLAFTPVAIPITSRRTHVVDTHTQTSTFRETTTIVERLTKVVPVTFTENINVTSTYIHIADVYTTEVTYTSKATVSTTTSTTINVTVTVDTTVLMESTLTVPAPSSFAAVQQASQRQQVVDSGGSNHHDLLRRGVERKERAAPHASIISCVTRLEPWSISTLTESVTRTITRYPPATSILSVMTTTTSTISVPSGPVHSTSTRTVSTTTTVTLEFTFPITSTVGTTTFTETSYTATRTSYLACASESLFGGQAQLQGDLMAEFDHRPALTSAVADAASPHDCCAMCQDTEAWFGPRCSHSSYDKLAAGEKCMLFMVTPQKDGAGAGGQRAE